VVTPSSSNDGLTLTAHRGEGAALLAFDVEESLHEDLAGFALRYRSPEGEERPIYNRLTFVEPVTAETTPTERRAISSPSDEAPLQKFHWVHFPSRVPKGTFTYTATAMRFKGGSNDQIESGPETSVDIDLKQDTHDNFELGFTRGYVSSQAYAELFDNAALYPKPQTYDFPSAEYVDRWRWLGFRARELVFGILDEAIKDSDAQLDVFAFDLDEPDLIRGLEQLRTRLRIVLDDSTSHVHHADKTDPPEVGTKEALLRSAGSENVRTRKFGALAHDKIFILTRGDGSRKVLSGSANFSVRGLYAQSNSVFVFQGDPPAARYAAVFDAAWKTTSGFGSSDLAKEWFELTGDGLPASSVSFAPHSDPGVSLDRVAAAIDGAKSSVLFAIMDIGNASGPVMDRVKNLRDREGLYTFGTTENLTGDLKATAPTDPDSPFIPSDYLRSKVPEPFRAEYSGGGGISIHHKFVVCDFNGERPVAYAGSSNLAQGGESRNGDNLVEFTDPVVVSSYAVEAIKLIDHYRFRAIQHQATKQEPMRLKKRSERWANDYFDPASPRHLERELFVRSRPSD
jgi:phosphatidylserine/phosphatidylglycerophosphate/cardiolipin synthase-like enzyme